MVAMCATWLLPLAASQAPPQSSPLPPLVSGFAQLLVVITAGGEIHDALRCTRFGIHRDSFQAMHVGTHAHFPRGLQSSPDSGLRSCCTGTCDGTALLGAHAKDCPEAVAAVFELPAAALSLSNYIAF